MEHLPINDLPNEVLEMIFDHLDVDYLKDASLVCRKWLDLAFSGRRMDRVMLVADFPWDNDLLQSKRKYRHLQLRDTEKCSAHVKELFQAFNVSSLRIKEDKYKCISHSSLRSILLEVPNLQQLSIVREPDQTKKMIEPLPVMRKLERLEIVYSNPESAIHWHTIAPSLQGLKMFCISKHHLKQLRLFSGQLKQVYLLCDGGNLMNRFCELTFPLLEELSINMTPGFSSYVAQDDFFQRHEFLRRHATLRRLRLDGFFLSERLLEDITNHNKKLVRLAIKGSRKILRRNQESLESLSQLIELKHLRLENLDTYIFHGCKVLTSLQSVNINDVTFGPKGMPGFLENLFKNAPQLRCLLLGSVTMTESVAQYICNKFTKLTRLQLTYSEEVSRDGLSEIDRLPHLWHLELNLTVANRSFASIIPQNKVRYLTLHLPNKYDEDDLLRLPEIFPQLERLNLTTWEQGLRESIVDRLRQLLPTCAIKTGGKFITNAGIMEYVWNLPSIEMIPVFEQEWIFKHCV